MRLGRNQRFAAIGGLSAALLMGLLGYEFSNRAIFLVAAALAVPTLIALRSIRSADIHFARACNASPGKYHPKHPPRTPRMFIGMNLHLLISRAPSRYFNSRMRPCCPWQRKSSGPRARHL